ncbi:uncharacterized protein ACR2FA_007883 [Aphomia sociella]
MSDIEDGLEDLSRKSLLKTLFSAHEIEYIEADAEYMQLNQSEIREADVQDEVDDHWEHDSIKLLLNLYLQNIDKFRNPKMRKKNVWVEIANTVGIGPDSCNKKFRNLKQTYIRLLKKKNKNEVARVKWPYFAIFEEIYSVNGEYQPEIQQKIQESSTENVAKVLLSINTPSFEADIHENGEGSSSQSEEARRKLNKRRYTEFRKATLEMRDRQRVVEEKLDRLISIVEESNSIQRERNRLFELFLEKLNNT